jgi:hypothetical protein
MPAATTKAPLARWLVKSEPDAFSWDQQVANGVEPWTGVRNHLAKKNLMAMRQGDLAFFYHSNIGKEVVGVVEVVREAYPDKRIISVAPPGRLHNRQIANWTDELVGIGSNLLARSMLPDRLKTAKGWIERPEAWSARPSLPPPPDPPPNDAGKTKAGHLRLVVSN